MKNIAVNMTFSPVHAPGSFSFCTKSVLLCFPPVTLEQWVPSTPRWPHFSPAVSSNQASLLLV